MTDQPTIDPAVAAAALADLNQRMCAELAAEARRLGVTPEEERFAFAVSERVRGVLVSLLGLTGLRGKPYQRVGRLALWITLRGLETAVGAHDQFGDAYEANRASLGVLKRREEGGVS